MKPRAQHLRLLVEIILIIGLSEVLVLFMLAQLVPQASAATQAALGVLGMTLLAGPALYWRFSGSVGPVAPTDSSAKPSRPPSHHLAPWLIALGVFSAGAGVSMLFAFQSESRLRNEIAERFEQQVNLIKEDVQDRFELPLRGLRGLAGLFAASAHVDRTEFRRYWEARDLAGDYPGVRGFGMIQEVAQGQGARFVAAQRRDGAPDFAIRTLGPAPQPSYVIQFVEPLQNNRQAVGLDVGSEPVRRRAVEQALKTGQPVLSGVITLVQDGRQSPGFLYILPLPAEERSPDAARKVVYSPIVLSELVQKTVQITHSQSHFEIYDGPLNTAQKLIFASEASKGSEYMARGHGEVTPHAPRYTHVQQLEIGGHPMTLKILSTQAFETTTDSNRPLLIGAGGSTLALVLAAAIWLLSRGRLMAEEKARELAADLIRLARVAEHTSNSVIIANAAYEIEWVNDAFVRICGISREQAVGRKVSDLRQTPQTDPEGHERIRAALEHRERIRLQTHHLASGGREYWLDSDIQPLLDDSGRPIGYVAVESDVTAEVLRRNELQDTLRGNRALMQTVHALAIVSETDVAGRITVVNDAFVRISGYERSELIGANHRILNSGEMPPGFWNRMWKTISSGKPWRGEVCNRAKNGALYWVDSMIAPFLDEKGKIERYVSIRVDITAAKNTQLELVRERGRLQNILEATNVGTLESNLLTGELRIDARWAAMLGYSLDELRPFTTEKWLAMAHPEDEATARTKLRELFAGKTDHFEMERRVRHKDGHWVWVLARARIETSNENGRIEWLTGTHLDITERKKSEEEARRSDMMLRASIDALEEAFVLYDPQDRLVMCNERYKELYAHTAPIIEPGRTFEELIRYGAERNQYKAAIGRIDEWVTERMAQHLSGNSDVIQELDNGRVVRILERKTPDGYIVGFRIDVTDLTRATQAAEAASRSKSQFLANMSHEIRTPMNAVLGMLTLLQNTALDAQQQDYTNKAEGAAKSLLDLLNDILDFSKIEAGKMAVDAHPFRLDLLLRDLAVILSTNASKKNIEVLFDLDEHVPMHLVGDGLRLKQILINLGGNAVKFTQQGEVVVKIHQVERRDGVAMLKFAVRDTGIGIAPENVQKIFEGFSQAEASTTRRFGGTGLGLAISGRLASLMGGALEVESEPGKGSTFHFTIPLTIQTGAETDAQPSLPAEAQNLSVLLIDDNPVALETLQGLVQQLKWDVEVARSGAQGLACIEARARAGRPPFQAIFVDWNMPEMDGWETSQKIREAMAGGEFPILLMVTAHGREMLAQRSREEQSRLDGYLVKPVTPSMLLDAVMDALAARRGLRPARKTTASHARRLLDMRILVVEDNLVNQQVAKELLQREGAQVTLADNGELGVQAVLHTRPPFHVVLMDVQMPVMDGFTATRTLRQRIELRSLPVIAITANAMASDRQDCLDAGMNDHVGKPFQIDQLVQTLLKHSGYVPPANTDTAAVRSVPAVSAALGNDTHTLNDRPELAVRSALNRMGDDLHLYTRIVDSFAQGLPEIPRQLEQLIAAGQMTDAHRLMHTLKGTAATVGADSLARVAKEIETALKTNVTPDHSHAFKPSLQQSIDTTLQAIASLKQSLVPAPTTDAPAQALDAKQLIADLRELQSLLMQSDMAAMDVFNRIREQHGHALSHALDTLDAAVNALDFAAARAICDDLMGKYQTPHA